MGCPKKKVEEPKKTKKSKSEREKTETKKKKVVKDKAVKITVNRINIDGEIYKKGDSVILCPSQQKQYLGSYL